MVNVTAGTDEASVLFRTLSHTQRPVGYTDHGTKFETGTTRSKQTRVRSVETVGVRERTTAIVSKIPDVASCAVLQPKTGDNRAKLEEACKAWEHQRDVDENLPASKMDDDVKLSVVLREAPSKNPRQTADEFPTVRE